MTPERRKWHQRMIRLCDALGCTPAIYDHVIDLAVAVIEQEKRRNRIEEAARRLRECPDMSFMRPLGATPLTPDATPTEAPEFPAGPVALTLHRDERVGRPTIMPL
jgi:hypothetical protein